MTEAKKMPFGSWPTPITSELVVRAAATPGEVLLDGDDVWWAERRPEEGGRTQLVRWRRDTGAVDVLPEGFDARTAVHEYGGRAWWVRQGVLWFANWTDQRLYRLQPEGDPPFDEPVPMSAPPAAERAERWADGTGTEGEFELESLEARGPQPKQRWIVAVRERHPVDDVPPEVTNELVNLDVTHEWPPVVIMPGADFVSNPRFSADGSWLSWLQWDRPDMPWDGTELYAALVRWSQLGPTMQAPEHVAGLGSRRASGNAESGFRPESVFQPEWAPDGSLWFVSDRTGWWNLYRWRDGKVEAMVEMEADIGVPQWVFGLSRYAFLDGGRVVFAYQQDGLDHLAVRSAEGTVTELDLPYTEYQSIQAAGDHVVLVAASPTSEATVVRLELDGVWLAGEPEVLRPPRDLGLDSEWFSVPEPIDFPTSGGRTAHALFYPPTNPEAAAPADEKPPLLVLIHGGPTSAARPSLKLGTQYWTSRGFAVVDVNYGGSTGYGRAYRDQLQGTWGVVDLDDCEAAARWLAEQGRVDAERLCIRGGSAGGYTTLAALAFRHSFAAGASHYGVADLEALAVDTHKFESRYLDGLVGPYPQAAATYRERSPIHHLDHFDRPLAVFQGLEDEIVPPNQAEMMVAALRERGVPVAYVTFEGEQHGFRQAPHIRRALDGELSFYAQVFGFDLPPEEDIEPIPVENLEGDGPAE